VIRFRLAAAMALALALGVSACGGSDSDGGVDTGLGFSVEVDESVPPNEQLRQYGQGIFDRVELAPELETCALANLGKADPAQFTALSDLSGAEQDAARQKLQAGFFTGCNLEAGSILEEDANEESERLVAFTLREELTTTLSAQGGAYAECVSKGLDELPDDELMALIREPDQAQELGTKIAEACGTPE
jgi:hypothetical protein